MRNVRSPALPAAKNSSDAPLPTATHSAFETVQAPPVKTEFDAVFESSGEALMVVDAQGTLHAANRRTRELLRLKKESLAHLRASDFLSTPAVDNFILWCEGAASATSAVRLDALLPTGHTIRVTLRTILPESHYMLVCLEEGSVVARAEEKWRHTDAELRSVLESVQAGVILLDSRGRVRASNDRFAQFFGTDARKLKTMEGFAELDGLLAGRFSNPEAFSKHWKSFADGQGTPAHDELEMTRPVRRVLERFSRPVLGVEGRAVGWLELYYDVTGERPVQSKKLQTEKMAALGQLVSGIAHELNNPLTAIMGYGQLLLGHGLPPPQLSEAKKIYQEAERARRIVKNLLYFARENKPERTRVDLNEIVERTLALRSYELKVEKILVECDLDPDLPETLADPYQLQQVILNLLVNAEQALLEGRGYGQVRIRTRHTASDRISLEISDDGPGIPLEIAWRIFDPFFTTKPSGVGTGLGLSIVYGIVKQHGGEVMFESHPKAGARFIVELPVTAVPVVKEAATPPGDPPPDGECSAVPPGRILVVEDEATVRQLIVDVLGEEGHRVEAVRDSQEGLTRVSRNRYDLVICDLRMPRLDGPAFFDALVRAGSPLAERIIFITGDTLGPRTLEFLESHRVPYLAKPFLVEELKIAVNRLLERSRKNADANSPVVVQQARSALSRE